MSYKEKKYIDRLYMICGWISTIDYILGGIGVFHQVEKVF